MNAYSKVLVDQKHPDQAIDMLGEIIGKFEQFPFSQERYQLGDLLFNKGEIKKAEVVWEKIPDDEKNILGRPNFACASIAHRMRDMGFEVATKAEAEQALVIFTMLEFYKEHGKDWADKMNEYLKAG